MTISLYGTTELIQVQQRFADLPDGFWRRLFPRVITSDREEVMFELADIPNRRLAPFVAPNVQGRVMKGQGSYARSFRPAYVKPKHIVDPTKAIARMMGEPLLGGRSMAQRFDAHVANNLRLEREAIELRWEWMASKAVIDGMVTIEGDDYPTQTVDFLRDATLTATLMSTAKWSALTTANPLGDIGDMCDLSFPLGNAPITDIVFGTAAWKNFTLNDTVIDLLSTLRRGGTSTFNTVPVIQSNFQSMGFIDGGSGGGRLNLWRYHNWYSDTASDGSLTVRQFLAENEVVGYGPALEGTALFGAIMDVDAGFLAEAAIFPKQWKDEDPSVVYTMSQSAPLFAPLNPNNSWKMTVQD